MQITGRIISYSILILVIGLLLKILGLFNTNISILFSFALILSGIGIFTNYFGTHRTKSLFISAFIFFIGFISLLAAYFTIEMNARFYLPTLLLIAGADFLLLFFENSKSKIFLLLAVILGGTGMLILKQHGQITLSSLFSGVIDIIRSFWLFLFLLVVILISVILREKK